MLSILRPAIALGLLGLGFAQSGVVGAAVADPNDALPARWEMGDFGTPFTWNGETFHIYADPVTNGQIARSLVVHDGVELIHPLDQVGDESSFYWLTDAAELPNGKLLVAALEVCTPGHDAAADACSGREYTDDGWGFVVFDTDLFVVNDPTEPGSWAAATAFGKIENGWWSDADQIEFSDQHPGLAFAGNGYGDGRTTVYEFNTSDPAEAVKLGRLPMTSSGQIAPVQTAEGWVAVTFDYWANTSTLWYAAPDDLLGEWVEGETTVYDTEAYGQTHAFGLNVVDGTVYARHSVLRQRPVFEQFTPDFPDF